ncbi:biotin/lipoyl-binding protein, partial [Pseudomonas aeruginosa]|nr:biotin/lipoyl-binding protein [Pseudomonas aeruginosa]
MYRHIPLVALSLFSSLLLAACGHGTPPPAPERPAIVVQPQPAGEVSQAFPGETRARHEPELAFRIGGKVIRRLVEDGERVKKDQPLAELDPQDVRLQLE